jgi:quinoprotein relay system zinc metallohydrolase 2
MKFLLSILFLIHAHVIHAHVIHAHNLSFKEIQPGIYVHQGEHLDVDEGYHGDIANIGFIIGKESVAVIDTGGSLEVGRQLLKAIREKTSLPISYVINTHVHLDHIYGNAAFIKQNPIFVGHKELPKAMLLRKEFYETTNQKFLNISPEQSIQIPPKLLISINEPQEIDLGNRKLRLEAFPSAHTNNDLIIVDIKTNTAWLADLMFTERTPSIDGDIHGWIDALDKIKKSNYKVIIPGHGAPPTNNAEAIQKIKSYLELLRNGIRQAIDNGLDLQEALNTIAISEKDKWELFDVQNPRNINMVYPIMEWE